MDRFTWCGEPITDVVQFCKDRGCKLVKYKHTVTHQSVFGGERTEASYGLMPEIFYDNLRLAFDSPCKVSEYFEEIERCTPEEMKDD